LLLLGYDLKKPEDMFDVLARSHLESRSEFAILRSAM
jgi:hypothetical protein